MEEHVSLSEERPTNGALFLFQGASVEEGLREYREHVRGVVHSIMDRYVHLRAQGDESGRSLDWSGMTGMSAPSLSDVTLWRLTVATIVAMTDRELRQQHNIESVCALYVRREIFGEKWNDIADRSHRSVSRCKEVVTAATARLYAEFVGRKVTDEISDLAA